LKKIGIYVNKNKDKSLLITSQIIELSKKYDFTCSVLIDSKAQENRETIQREEDFARDNDIIIVLGGDGTILRIAATAAVLGTPLLSVNLGHLGFLTQLEADELEEGLKRIYDSTYTLESRMMLLCKANGNEYLALNDVCLQRASRARLLKFTTYVNGEYVDSLSADGVLVSSPTGSTAYSLSAGGPIVSPKLSLMIVTPICAHTLRARPFVFSDSEKLKIETKDECGFAVNCDGVQLHALDGVHEVEVEKSQYSLKLITFNQNSFFKKLNSKFIEWNL